MMTSSRTMTRQRKSTERMSRKLIIILGPTAVGKTDYSIEMALKYGSPIISCDSRQIYKEMTIGTAVPSAEQLAAVQHYFIHSHTVRELYTAGKYELEALELINRLFDEGHETLVMAGGSGFYVDALVNGLDDFPSADMQLRDELMRRLREEGVESLRMELKSLDPESYAAIDIANGQRVVRALEVCLMTGRPFSSFKTASRKSRDFEIEKIGLTLKLYDRVVVGPALVCMLLKENALELIGAKDIVGNAVSQNLLYVTSPGECHIVLTSVLVKIRTLNKTLGGNALYTMAVSRIS